MTISRGMPRSPSRSLAASSPNASCPDRDSNAVRATKAVSQSTRAFSEVGVRTLTVALDRGAGPWGAGSEIGESSASARSATEENGVGLDAAGETLGGAAGGTVAQPQSNPIAPKHIQTVFRINLRSRLDAKRRWRASRNPSARLPQPESSRRKEFAKPGLSAKG